MDSEMFGVLVLLQELAMLLAGLDFPPAHLDLRQPLEFQCVPAPHICGLC